MVRIKLDTSVTAESATERLFQRLVTQDEAALAEVYDEFAPRVLGLLVRMVRSRPEAEEELPSVFLRLWREAPTELPARASVSAHVVQLAREAALNRRPAAPPPPSSAPARRPLPKGRWLPTAGQVARVDDRRELLSRILRQLPAPQREEIERVVFEGLTEEEVAKFRSEPLGRAQDELRAGLAFLRQRLLTLVGTWTAGI